MLVPCILGASGARVRVGIRAIAAILRACARASIPRSIAVPGIGCTTRTAIRSLRVTIPRVRRRTRATSIRGAGSRAVIVCAARARVSTCRRALILCATSAGIGGSLTITAIPGLNARIGRAAAYAAVL